MDLSIKPINIEDEIKSSYLDYSMSVIIGRALPDVRDGLKPVHRRVLYSMYELNLDYGKPYKKSARVVGDCIGKYHPHGDAAVYDTIVRLAQDFSMRYPLVDGQGNFGSVDGDPPAAMRYTEVRMSKITSELLKDIEKNTIDYQENYDNSLLEPIVLPTQIPNLLINGASGIAVGMSTNIPPHNSREIINATIEVINNPDITVEELFSIVKGPDFPTAGYILGSASILEAYKTGRGIITMRGKVSIEKSDKGEREIIIINEIPFQLNKTRLIESIVDLVRDKKVEGISEIRDESNREGIRIVLELKRDVRSNVVLNNLYKFTPLQSSFGIIMLAIVNGQPEILSLKSALTYFISHRKEVVVRRVRFELKKAEERAHILLGFKIALENLDEIITLIRSSESPSVAKQRLTINYKLSEIQAQAILDLRLQKLTALERDKILEEYNQLLKIIEDLNDILSKEERIYQIIIDELKYISEKYGDTRKTEIINVEREFTELSLIPKEEMVVTISHQGYIKRTLSNVYRNQKRGGRGKMAMATKEEDFVSDMFIASNHDRLMVFTSKGRVYWIRVLDIPLASRTAKGKPIVNIIDFHPEERVSAVLPVHIDEKSEEIEKRSVVMVTKMGVIKQTDLSAFNSARTTGVIACTLDEGDELAYVRLAKFGQDIFLASHQGKVIRFSSDDVRIVGRAARGVYAMDLKSDDFIVSVEIVNKEDVIDDSEATDSNIDTSDMSMINDSLETENIEDINDIPSNNEMDMVDLSDDTVLKNQKSDLYLLTVTENGYGKKTPISLYRRQKRGGMGSIDVKTSDRNGCVVGVVQIKDNDEIMLITNFGQILRTFSNQVRKTNRNTLGVKLMNLEADEKIVSIARIIDTDSNVDLDVLDISEDIGYSAEAISLDNTDINTDMDS